MYCACTVPTLRAYVHTPHPYVLHYGMPTSELGYGVELVLLDVRWRGVSFVSLGVFGVGVVLARCYWEWRLVSHNGTDVFAAVKKASHGRQYSF
jgi:hypothetical protein